MTTSAVVLLSGGLDSTISLFWAREHFDEVHALSFRCGRRASPELEAARHISTIAQVSSWRVLDLGVLEQLGGLLNPFSATTTALGRPSNFVPGRHLLMLTVAGSYAVQLGARSIITGVTAADLVPDHHEPFLQNMEKALNLAMPFVAQELVLEAPLLGFHRGELLRLAQDLPGCWRALSKTITCEEGRRPGCGNCLKCSRRFAGFRSAKLRDPAPKVRDTRQAQVGDWVWSETGEVYGEPFASRAAATADATKKLGFGAGFYLARVAEVGAGVVALQACLNVDDLRARAEEWLLTEYGADDNESRWEQNEDGVEVWNDLEHRLEQTIESWALEHGVRNVWYLVGESEWVEPVGGPPRG